MTAIELNTLFCGLYILVLENCSIQNSPSEVFWHPFICDSNTLSSNTFAVSSIYNCNIIDVYCLNAYGLFAAF